MTGRPELVFELRLGLSAGRHLNQALAKEGRMRNQQLEGRALIPLDWFEWAVHFVAVSEPGRAPL